MVALDFSQRFEAPMPVVGSTTALDRGVSARGVPLLGIACVLAVVLCVAPVGATERREGAPRVASPELERGMLLIARRGMPDPRFKRTVILLADHHAQGSLGLILNRRSEVAPGRLVPELLSYDLPGHRIYIGGPVHFDQLLFLFRHPSFPGEASAVMGDVYLGGSLPMLKRMLAAGTGEDRLRLYLGYAGWASGQLVGELKRGDWFVHPADPREVFAPSPGDLWHRWIQRFDPDGLQASWRETCACALIPRLLALQARSIRPGRHPVTGLRTPSACNARKCLR